MHDHPEEDLLYDAILSLKDRDECRAFFHDLCTMTELKAMSQRIEVARLLDRGLIYSDILSRTGTSSATVSRVNRALQYGADGYRIVLDRLDK
ncbi:MAG: YerC/YecD family TrpR-related protein [Oscillospiraceae bacterium]|nr:YerC/YecD family TrpR-related protein [Oscillospiraceae bacterium]